MRWIAPRLAGVVVVVTLGGCDAIRLGAMNAAGPVAEAQRHLYLVLAVVLVFVAGPVLVLTPIIAWHYRLSNRDRAFRPAGDFSWWLEGLIWLPPAGIVVGLSVLLWDYTHRLDPYAQLRSAQPPIEVQAVALDWKWLFIYPAEHVATLNQLAIPAGRAVHMSLTSGTVMQALLIPRLAGQIAAMPGMRTQLNFAASRPGRYRGENTQYNGAGFARESFDVVAMPPDAFDRWLGQARTAARPLDRRAYAGLFVPSSLARPVAFSSVPDHLFETVLAHGGHPGMGSDMVPNPAMPR